MTTQFRSNSNPNPQFPNSLPQRAILFPPTVPFVAASANTKIPRSRSACEREPRIPLSPFKSAVGLTVGVVGAEMGAGLTVGVVGVLILFHAAYSTIRCRAFLKITEEEFSGPPFNVVIELSWFVALFLDCAPSTRQIFVHTPTL